MLNCSFALNSHAFIFTCWVYVTCPCATFNVKMQTYRWPRLCEDSLKTVNRVISLSNKLYHSHNTLQNFKTHVYLDTCPFYFEKIFQQDSQLVTYKHLVQIWVIKLIKMNASKMTTSNDKYGALQTAKCHLIVKLRFFIPSFNTTQTEARTPTDAFDKNTCGTESRPIEK